MSIAALELVSVLTLGEKVTLDSNGERRLTPDECFTLADRLINEALRADGECALRPFGDQIVVRVIEIGETTSAGGIHLPDKEVFRTEPGIRGVVLAVGPQVPVLMAKLGIAIMPEIGDIILFPRSAGMETVVGDKRYLVMKVSNALTRIVREAQPPA